MPFLLVYCAISKKLRELILSFDPIEGKPLTRDGEHYFYKGEQSDIDYNSFEIIYGGVVIDKNHVYRYGKITDKTVEEARTESEARFKRNNPNVEL